ncbi:hypothetical protein ABMY26_30635 [Azospirillum sp. HJ39]|uniref:hypothetical protein n=1 Tax=Azospirillum sp. HJ39 TaxID=3159496 RepID=UPI003556CF0E
MSKIHPDHDENPTGEPVPSIVILRSEARKPTGSRWQATFLALSADRVKPFFRPLYRNIDKALSCQAPAPIFRSPQPPRSALSDAIVG